MTSSSLANLVNAYGYNPKSNRYVKTLLESKKKIKISAFRPRNIVILCILCFYTEQSLRNQNIDPEIIYSIGYWSAMVILPFFILFFPLNLSTTKEGEVILNRKNAKLLLVFSKYSQGSIINGLLFAGFTSGFLTSFYANKDCLSILIFTIIFFIVSNIANTAMNIYQKNFHNLADIKTKKLWNLS